MSFAAFPAFLMELLAFDIETGTGLHQPSR